MRKLLDTRCWPAWPAARRTATRCVTRRRTASWQRWRPRKRRAARARAGAGKRGCALRASAAEARQRLGRRLAQRLGPRSSAEITHHCGFSKLQPPRRVVIGTDGRIHSNYRDASSGWGGGWFNVSGGTAALGSEITAVARSPAHLDLFATGTSGLIYSTYWDQSTGWGG